MGFHGGNYNGKNDAMKGSMKKDGIFLSGSQLQQYKEYHKDYHDDNQSH